MIQVPGLVPFLQRRTWEKGGYAAHLRGILDDDGRAMVLINWNRSLVPERDRAESSA